jgi:RNA polymerase sigma-70 factor (ECF subfamily)
MQLANQPRLAPDPEGVDDAALVRLVLAGDTQARAAFFDRHSALVQRVLARLLGADAELEDLLHDVFVEAFMGVHGLRDPRAMRAWLVGIAAHTARRCIRRRQRGRWLMFPGEAALPEPTTPVGEEAYSELRTIQWLLAQLSVDEQLVLSLRWLEGMQVDEVAQACGLSHSTTKRRLAAAEKRFRALARRHPEVERWFGGAP